MIVQFMARYKPIFKCASRSTGPREEPVYTIAVLYARSVLHDVKNYWIVYCIFSLQLGEDIIR